MTTDSFEGPGPQGKYDELLAGPPAAQDLAAPLPTLDRLTAPYVSHDARYKLPAREYDRQYAQLYFYRLVQMRGPVERAARARWPDATRFVRILDIPEDGEVVIVGTVYKEMALKPSILDEYTKERALAQHLGRTHFTSSDDRLVLEDEGARVALGGTGISPFECVTGVVAAVRGSVLPNGEFAVVDCCFAGVPPQPPLPAIAGDKYVAFVSGLGLGEAEGEGNALKLQLLVDYLTGALGGGSEQEMASRIVRVVVAGGLLRGSAALSQPTAYSAVRQQAAALAPVREADMRLSELASAVPVDVLPSAADPANYSLPQQPLHRCLFPGASRISTFTRCTNPHSFEVDGVHFLGTGGQNVDDVARYSDIDDRVAIMEKLLNWTHLIPTAPDTLATYPYYDADPFILQQAPHVLFAGGQPTFGTALISTGTGPGIRILSVPDFARTATLVLVNIGTLAVHPIQFDVDMQP